MSDRLPDQGLCIPQFKDKETAGIAVKAMDGYIMFGKQIDCHLVTEPHKDTFKNGNRDWKFVPHQTKFRNEKNRTKTDEE